MDIDPEILELLKATFAGELDELTPQLTDGLLALERGADAGARQDALDQVFRVAHTIKGGARSVGIVSVEAISHELESALGLLKKKNQAPSPVQIDLCLEAVDKMSEATAAFLEDRPLSYDLDEFVSRLQDPGAPRSTAAPEPAGQASVHERAPALAQVFTPAPAPVVAPVSAAPTPEPVAQPAPGKQRGAPPAAAGTEAKADILRVPVERIAELGATIESLQGARIELDDHCTSVSGLTASLAQLQRRWSQAQDSWRGAPDAIGGDLLRLLEETTDAVFELSTEARTVHRELTGAVDNLSRTTTSLGAHIGRLRLVSAGTLLQPMAREVRDLARETGKRVELEVSGADIQVDRAVLNAVRGPLIHLVRNAVDHGVEAPDLRERAGKSPVGQIGLHVQAEGSWLELRVSDDGAGVDGDRVADSAVAKGVITPQERERLDPAQKLEILFAPGFTSKEIITNISGRGVGLDAVRTAVRAMKGHVSIDTTVGEGTTFVLRVPLSLAAEVGLLVRVSGRVCAIPVGSIERILAMPKTDVRLVDGSEVVPLGDAPVALRDLGQVLGWGPSESSGDLLSIVVIANGFRQLALVVDEVVGQRELVIKPLTPPLYKVRYVVGGTLTGRGGIIIVLDAVQLVDGGIQAAGRRLGATADEGKARVRRVLVVDDSITTRTLERNILENRGYDVTVAVDGRQAWEEVLAAHDFDLIITDVEMPHMNGFELTERIRASERHENTPVIIVTSLGSPADESRGLQAGADAYIVKGQFETRVLVEVVEQLIG